MTRRSAKGSAYPKNWEAIAAATKARAEWKCVRCGHAHDPDSGHTLTVHHADMNPGNSAWWNLLALCQRCHLSIQGRVDLRQAWMHEHSEWFRPFVAGFFAHLAGVRSDLRFVTIHIDELIDFGRGRLSKENLTEIAVLFTRATARSIEVDGGRDRCPRGRSKEVTTP